jgi:hypothetical protein
MILIIGFNNLISKCTSYFTIHGDWMWNMKEKSIIIVYLHWEQFFFLFFILISVLYFIFATTNDAIQYFHEAPFKLVFCA